MSMFVESAPAEAKSHALPPMGINPDTITFAGDSGGSYMSTNMHVIHSDVVKGAGLMIGGPYAFDWIGTYETDVPEDTLQNSFDLVDANWKAGLIDDPANLKGSVAMVISGSKDKSVSPYL